MIEKLDQLARDGRMHGFTIWPSHGGYQANLQSGVNAGWRVRRAETPGEAIALVLAMDYADEIDERLAPREPYIGAPPAVDEPPFPDYETIHADDGIFD